MLSGGHDNNTRAISYEDTERVVNFVTNFTEEHGLVLPGCVPGYKRDDLRLLPSSETKASIHRKYEQAMKQSGLWQNVFPL